MNLQQQVPTMADEEIDALVEALQLKNDQSRHILIYALNDVVLFDKKHSDYGPFNIAVLGVPGVTYRIFEKATRLVNLLKKKPRNESRRDGYADISVLAMIVRALDDGQWNTNNDNNDKTTIQRPAPIHNNNIGE